MRISLCLSISWQKLCFTLTFTTQPRISIIWVSLLHVAFFTLSRTFLWTPFQTLLKLDAVVMKPVSASLVVILLSLPQQQQLLQFWHNSIRIDVNVLFYSSFEGYLLHSCCNYSQTPHNDILCDSPKIIQAICFWKCRLCTTANRFVFVLGPSTNDVTHIFSFWSLSVFTLWCTKTYAVSPRIF